MKAEKVIFSFVALFIGLIVAGGAFYFIQSARGTKPQPQPKNIQKETPTPVVSDFTLTINKPIDGEVVKNKLLTITGETDKDAIVVISTPLTDEVVKPTANGTFSATITLDDDYNEIVYTAIAPNGTEVIKTQTLTYSTEDF